MSYTGPDPFRVGRGGTGATTLTGVVSGNGTTPLTASPVTQYATLVGGASNAVSSVAPSATSGVPLISQRAAANPTFGTAAVAGGGTGAVSLTGVLTGNGTSAFTANAVTQYAPIIGGASNAVASVGIGISGQVFQSKGAGVAADYSTATYPATTTANQLLYSSATNTVGEITTANNGVLITSAAGVPSLLAAGTTGQVLTATTGAPASWANIKIVQIVSNLAIAGSSTASTTAVDVTGASLAITPTSASNSVLVCFNFQATQGSIASTNVQMYNQILRNAVNISGVDRLRNSSDSGTGGDSQHVWLNWIYIDSPATTSATTYKLQQRISNASTTAACAGINIILIEIAP